MQITDLFFLTLIILITCFFFLSQAKQQRKIRQWKKSLNLGNHERIFHALYQSVNGFKLSNKARKHRDAFEYAYGEIEWTSFIALLSLVAINEKTVFYDLGCGVGKAVIACAMVYPVQQSVGIELFSELHTIACQQATTVMALPEYHEKKIKLILGDFLEVNLNDATLIFINATAFFGTLWRDICSKLDTLPHLNQVITTSRALDSNLFEMIMRTKVKMSWGVVSAFIHTKKQPGN